MDSFSGKTVLVTGATGLIGSHIVDALMRMGDVDVVALSRSHQKLEEGFADYIGKPNFRYIAQDITIPLQLPDLAVDFIFHAAGPMEGEIIANFPVNVIEPNIIGTKNCLDFLIQQNESSKVSGRLILFSSVTVYGNNSDKDIKVTEIDTNITEALTSKTAPYSQSKRMSEVIALAYVKQYYCDVVIARFSTVYGNTRFIPNTAFYEFIKKAGLGENIVLNGSGFAKRDNIYIDDAVKAVLLLAQKGKSGEAYNISSGAELGNFLAVDEIADIIAEITNKIYRKVNENATKVIRKEGVSSSRKAGLILDNSKLKALGWAVETSFEQGIRHTVKEYGTKIN